MQHDPHWVQTGQRLSSRSKILNALRIRNLTFSELLEITQLSRPVLSDKLSSLQQDLLVIRVPTKGRREYTLTQRGKGMLLLRSRALSKGYAAAGTLVPNPKDGKALVEMAELAVRSPEVFQVMLDFFSDLVMIIDSNPIYEKRWLRAFSDEKEQRLIQDAIKKRFAGRPRPRTLEEFREALKEIKLTITQALGEGKQVR